MFFIITFILLILGLGAIVFFIRQGRSKAQAQDSVSGYEKLGSQWGASSATAEARHQGEQLVDLNDKEDDDDDEDIVYMSRDGTVYRKFRYGQQGDQEEQEPEYSAGKYSFPQ